MDALINDVRFALRMMRKNVMFTIISVLAFAIGIGANTAIFSVVNATLLRPLPFNDPDRLVLLWGNVLRTKLERRGASLPDYVDWRKQSRSFDDMAAWWDPTFTMYGGEEPERIKGEVVAPSYLSLLGVQPALGRAFRSEEELDFSAPPVALLSYGLWVRRFGGESSIVGKSINLDQKQYTVIGVLPAGFRGLSDAAEIWVPLAGGQGVKDEIGERGDRWFPVLAKLKRGVSLRQAQAEVDTVAKSLERAYPATNEKRGVEIATLNAETFGDIRPALLVIMAAVGFVLLIACANVANFLLAKAEARQREIAVRAALGASRGRLLQQVITESILLSLIGAAVGAVIAVWGVTALTTASPITLPTFVKPHIDLTVALFTLVVSVVTGAIVGLAPALHASRTGLHDALKQATGRSSDGVSGQRFRGALVIAQVALVLVLLTGAGLLIRSFRELARLDPGFIPDHLLSLRIGMPRPTTDQQTATSARMIADRVRSLPGVKSVALGSDIPLSGDGGAILFTAEGQPPVTAQNVPRAYTHRVTPGFFATLGIPMLRGRDFLPNDAQGVVVVAESVGKRFWPGQDPIGHRIKPGRSDSKNPWLTIVGVVAEVKYRGLPANPTADPDLYFPFAERSRNFALFVRTAGTPSSLSGALRGDLHSLDKTMTIFDVTPMLERVATQMARSRFTSWLTGIFSVVALLLAAIGIYGVTAHSVNRRTREIGIRMALGASKSDVLGAVIWRGMLLVGAGIAIGLVAAFGLTRLIEKLLFGVTTTDPLTFAAVTAVLAGVALLATYVPARRAAGTDPIEALRYE
jgi:putative ABC transport system permease protein